MHVTILDFIKAIEKYEFTDKEMGVCRLKKYPPPDHKMIQSLEGKFNIQLPQSYVDFILYAGAAEYFGVRFLPVHSLFVLDHTNWEMQGFVPFAVDSFSNFFAFDPNESSHEYIVCKCSHDPFGYAQIADSFDVWLKLHYIFIEKLMDGKAFDHPYFDAEDEIAANNRRYRKSLPRKWWEVWK